MSLLEIIIFITFYMIAVSFATIGREIFFGLMALRYGDETPRIVQRITLNPLKHIDIFGTIIIPLTLIFMGATFMFGYAKPMPINFLNIQEKTGLKGCLYVALAGTFFNILVAFTIVATLKLGLQYHLIQEKGLFLQFLLIIISINITIAIFNLIPIPPLDGAKILGYLGLLFHSTIFLRWYNNFEKYGIILIIFIVLFPPTRDSILRIIELVIILFLKL